MPYSAKGLSRRPWFQAGLVLIAILLLHQYWSHETSVAADSARFDYVHVISPMYLYNGRQGILLLDNRNGNVWFIGKSDDQKLTFLDPVFVVHVPLEKLDQAP